MRRLWAPALAFGIVSLFGITAATTLGLRMHGGLLTEGLYVLALQLVVSALALSAIDDLRTPQPSRPVTRRRRPGRRARARLTRALWRFYLANPVPAGLLGFGAAMSLTLVAVGVLGQGTAVTFGFGPILTQTTVGRSELALAALLTLTVLATLGLRGAGRYGWVVGFVAGVVVGQVAIVQYTDPALSIIVWGALAGALMLCTALVSVARGLIRRRRKAVPA